MRSKLFSKLDFFLKVEFDKLDFGLENKRYSHVFFSGVCQKCHYRYPIVVFYINAAIGNKKTPL